MLGVLVLLEVGLVFGTSLCEPSSSELDGKVQWVGK